MGMVHAAGHVERHWSPIGGHQPGGLQGPAGAEQPPIRGPLGKQGCLRGPGRTRSSPPRGTGRGWLLSLHWR